MQKYVTFDMSKPLDFIPIGRIAIDFNPTDMYRPLSESANFNKYVGGSPANIAVGLARLGCKVGFCGCVSDDQFGDYVVNYFEMKALTLPKSQERKTERKSVLHLPKFFQKKAHQFLCTEIMLQTFVLSRATLTRNTLHRQRQ